MCNNLLVPFRSDSGNAYVYDTSSNRVITCSEAMSEVLQRYSSRSREALIEELSFRYDFEEVEANYNLVSRWHQAQKVLLDEDRPDAIAGMTEESYWKTLFGKVGLQLVLVVTQACNLRCRYCIYGEMYPQHPSYESTTMQWSTARAAIDYFLDYLTQPDRVARYSGKEAPLSISFYGGEPLLCMDLIRECVAYVIAKTQDGPHTVKFNMTTNATLLTEERVEYLAKHDFNLAISLDGPPTEHDRNRRTAKDGDTHETVMAAVKRLRGRYEEYWRTRCSILATYDVETDFEAVVGYFGEAPCSWPRTGRWNPVSPHETSYYSNTTPEQRERSSARRRRCDEAYVENLRTGGDPGALQWAGKLNELERYELLVRQQQWDVPSSTPQWYSAVCLPGTKLAVYPNGEFHVCEKVVPNFPIGSCETGIEYARVKALLERFHEQVIEGRCARCPRQHLCNVCFAHLRSDGSFDTNTACAASVALLPSQLAHVYSLIEQIPGLVDKARGYTGDWSDMVVDRSYLDLVL